MLYLGFNIFPRSVFWSVDFNGRSDNTDVIHLKPKAISDLATNYRTDRTLGELGSENYVAIV